MAHLTTFTPQGAPDCAVDAMNANLSVGILLPAIVGDRLAQRLLPRGMALALPDSDCKNVGNKTKVEGPTRPVCCAVVIMAE